MPSGGIPVSALFVLTGITVGGYIFYFVCVAIYMAVAGLIAIWKKRPPP